MTLTLVQFEYAWEIHAYLRLAGIFYEEDNRDYPISSIEGKQSYIIDKTFVVSEDRAIQYLKDNYTNIDLDYSDIERSEISIYSYLLNTVGRKLFNKRRWLKWSTLRKSLADYRSIIGFPYNVYYGLSCWNGIRQNVNTYFSVTEQSEEEALEVLESCYAFSNTKLASQKEPDFIFGYRPSTLDVMMIGHLARIQECPQSLQHVVENYPELMKYFERMLSGYFVPLTVQEGCELSTNSFLAQQNLQVEISSKKLCYIERKSPIEDDDDQELSEEERIMKEEENRLQRTKNWRIGVFSALAILGIGIYMASEITQLLSELRDDNQSLPLYSVF